MRRFLFAAVYILIALSLIQAATCGSSGTISSRKVTSVGVEVTAWTTPVTKGIFFTVEGCDNYFGIAYDDYGKSILGMLLSAKANGNTVTFSFTEVPRQPSASGKYINEIAGITINN
jgi:hypothetical protein